MVILTLKRWLYLVLGFTLIILSLALAVIDLTILKTGAITPFIPLIIALLGVIFLDIYRRYPTKIPG